MKEIDDRIDHSAEIIAAISRLTDRQKIAVLAAMLGYTQAETGEIMGIRQNAVHYLLQRSRPSLVSKT